MTITLVDVGSTANDGTGDPLRTAFQTVNTALTRLDNTVDVQTGYVLLKDDSGSTGVAVTTAGNVGIGTTSPASKLHVANGYVSLQSGATSFTAPAAALNLHYSTSSGIATFGPTGASNTYLDLTTSQAGVDKCVLRLDFRGDASFYNAGATVGMTWDASANSNAGGLGIGTTTPTEQLDLSGDAIRIRTSQTPASAAATGDAGMICWDASYIYVCTATNTWKRAAIATW